MQNETNTKNMTTQTEILNEINDKGIVSMVCEGHYNLDIDLGENTITVVTSPNGKIRYTTYRYMTSAQWDKKVNNMIKRAIKRGIIKFL